MKSFIASARQLVYDISMVVIHDGMKNVSNLPDWGAEFGTTDECYGVPHVRGEHSKKQQCDDMCCPFLISLLLFLLGFHDYNG